MDPHNRENAKIEYAHGGCQGHLMTHYHCGAKCHDCGWGGCGCLVSHCCCQEEGPSARAQQRNKKARLRRKKRAAAQ
jgi:hypothetical protein